MRLRLSLGLLLAVTTVGPTFGQTTFSWNGTTTDWGASSGWTPPGPPTATDIALFSPGGALPFVSGSGTNPTLTPLNNPSLNGDRAALSATFGPNARLGGWTLTGGPNTLTLGGTGSTGLTTRGPATIRLTGIVLAGVGAAATASALNLNVGGGSELVFDGSTSAVTNIGTTASAAVNVSGTLTLDNTLTNVPNRLSTAAGLFFTSGTLNLLGSGTTTYTAGPLANSNTAGTNTFRVTPSGGTSTLQFANGTAGTAFNSRLSTFSVLRFEAGGGATLGDTARITFVGNPGVGANGLLASSTTFPTGTAGTFGYALASDAGGTDFATYSATAGVGIIRAGATKTATTLAGLGATTINDRAQYNPAANDSSGVLTVGSLRITPTANNLSADFGTSNLATNALMLDGAFDYTLSGTGSFGATGTRYIHVNNPAASLTTSQVVVGSNNPTSFAGPGFLILNGTAVQAVGQAGTAANRFDLLGGTVRGTNANLGFQVAAAGSDAFAVLNFRGGVLEIAGGANGAGTAADFTRALGGTTGDGQVRWEGGAGGFSAFGSAASVNIGGTAAPTGLQWAATNFVPDGQPLRFGSARSNAPVLFLNPVQLDNGTGYQLREVNVVAGAGGDRTVFTGNVTGSASADLIKTGGGTLALTAAGNAYAGNTYVQAGTLIAGTAGAGGGRVFVRSGAALYPGALTTGTEARPAPATLGINPQFDLEGGSTLRIRVSGAVTPATQPAPAVSGTAGTVNSQLSAGAGGITLGNGTSYVVDLTNTTGLTAGQPYRFQIGTSTGSNVIVGTTGSITFLDNGTDISGSVTGATVLLNGTGVFLTFTPVPEPMTVLAVAAAGLGGLRLGRRLTASSRRPA